MDAVNTMFMPRCMSNPALFTRCSIMWFGEWRRDSMVVVPPLLFPDLIEEVEEKDELIQHMVNIHLSTAGYASADTDESKTGEEFVFNKVP